jgi:hypothetical protein
MNNKILILLVSIIFGLKVLAQPCGISQTLTPSQQSQINVKASLLDSALKYENLNRIDSLSLVIKSSYGIQAGRPEDTETFYALVSNMNWINLTTAIALSRQLIANDSLC